MEYMIYEKEETGKKHVKIPKEFLKGELRSGFLVPKQLKFAWSVELECLAEVDRICKKYGLKYFADSGTLLGAARHKGFIPWDDDIDIAMPRRDYDIFNKICGKEVESRFSFIEPLMGNFKNFEQPLCRVIENMDKKFLGKDFNNIKNTTLAAGIDIFPLDYMAPKDEIEIQMALIDILLFCIKNFNKEKRKKKVFDTIPKVEEMCNVHFDRDGDLFVQLKDLFLKVCTMYKEDESDEVTVFPWIEDYPGWHFKKEWYSDAILMDFEFTKIPVPIGWERILDMGYGNWREFARGAASHDFPFYRARLKELKADELKRVKEELPKEIGAFFNISPEDIRARKIIKKSAYATTVLMKIKNDDVIFRIPKGDINLQADYTRENKIYGILKDSGITDEMLYLDSVTGNRLSQYIRGAKPLDVNDDVMLESCIDFIKYYHDKFANQYIDKSFDIWNILEKYETMWEDKSYFPEYDDAKKKALECYDFAEKQKKTIGIVNFNLEKENFLIKKVEEGTYDICLTGWEYSGFNDIHMDIAMLIARSLMSYEQADRVIDYYFGGECDADLRKKIYAYAVISSLILNNRYEYLDRNGEDMLEERAEYFNKTLYYYQRFNDLPDMENKLI